ncbi:hypothetical protein Hdeb2414_s0001g00016021 [Helianthus debilis subsp. tardiflorus]
MWVRYSRLGKPSRLSQHGRSELTQLGTSQHSSTRVISVRVWSKPVRQSTDGFGSGFGFGSRSKSTVNCRSTAVNVDQSPTRLHFQNYGTVGIGKPMGI